ncbi:MAG: hypothetical protein R2705_21330 [Ilumatobacteraceae bacterium]
MVASCIISGSHDGTVRGPDHPYHTPGLTGHTGPVVAGWDDRGRWSPRIISGSHDGTARVWDLTTPYHPWS